MARWWERDKNFESAPAPGAIVPAIGAPAMVKPIEGLQRFYVLGEVVFLLIGQAEAENFVVVIHHIDKRSEPSVVEESALLHRLQTSLHARFVHVRPQSGER